MAIRFPKNPNEGREDRFRDPQGKNPFADASEGPEAGDDNLYAAPAADPGQSYQPQHVTTQAHRGALILTCGLLGMVGSSFALVSVAITSYGGVCLMVVPWISLAVTLPACFMGYADTKAIRAGAMDPKGLSATRSGYIMGLIGAAITFALTLYYIAAILAMTFNG